jgi:hypothetical protein
MNLHKIRHAAASTRHELSSHLINALTNSDEMGLQNWGPKAVNETETLDAITWMMGHTAKIHNKIYVHESAKKAIEMATKG